MRGKGECRRKKMSQQRLQMSCALLRGGMRLGFGVLSRTTGTRCGFLVSYLQLTVIIIDAAANHYLDPEEYLGGHEAQEAVLRRSQSFDVASPGMQSHFTYVLL